jgi:hypothetical protein
MLTFCYGVSKIKAFQKSVIFEIASFEIASFEIA